MFLSFMDETQSVSSCFCPLWMKHKVFLHVSSGGVLAQRRLSPKSRLSPHEDVLAQRLNKCHTPAAVKQRKPRRKRRGGE
ncbi:hypothetical protein HanHA89_Chr13g0502001 [Helianthus annuus]|nr:hypothetical protein HanHA89_Chr13g0502001 [Helianthus annuus]